MHGQPNRVAHLAGFPSVEAVPWENLRLPCYAELAKLLRGYRREPEDSMSSLTPATLNLSARSRHRDVGAGLLTAEEHARVLKGMKPT